MALMPRLPNAANDFTLTITVNKKLLPYLTEWYKRKKNDGESTEDFALRVLKSAAIGDYVADIGTAQAKVVEAVKETSIKELQGDVTLLETEV